MSEITKRRIETFDAYRASLTPAERGILDQELDAFCKMFRTGGPVQKRLGPDGGKELMVAIMEWKIKHPGVK